MTGEGPNRAGPDDAAPRPSAPATRPEPAPDDPSHPLDPRDYSRRTLLAGERTYLAWWRTGLTLLTVALAAARVVPELSGSSTTWPYTVLGVVFAALGIVCIACGEQRRAAIGRALRRGEFAELSGAFSLVLTAAGTLAGIAVVLVILINP